jgi:Raf kinase inhibitor-like YbhB/YbcL family protein
VNPVIERGLGRLLRGLRGHDAKLAWNAPPFRDVPVTIAVTSPAFAEGATIPDRHAGDGVGDNLSPPLAWSGLPEGTRELAIIMEDPDAPLPRPIVHLIAAGIAPDRPGLPEGALNPGTDPSIRFGRGAFGRIGYVGPRPVRGHGPHRYLFELYALREPLDAAPTLDLDAALAAMRTITLARGLLTGVYERR